jgi:hypothetical protein
MAPVAIVSEELAALAGVRCTAEEIALLSALFPPQDFVYWPPPHLAVLC